MQLVCTEMCACNGDETCCDNVERDVEESETSDSSESDTDMTMIVEQFHFFYRLSLTLQKMVVSSEV